QVPTAVQMGISNLHLHVAGDETFDKVISNVQTAAASGHIRFHYVPGIQAGMLTFAIDALNGDATQIIANGISSPVTLASGAVDTTITLKAGSAATCTMASQCPTGFCVDGVCCNSACNGTCESCAVPGSLGTCTAVPDGTDPDGECRSPQLTA